MAGAGHTGATVSRAKQSMYFDALERGLSKRAACRLAGIGNTTARMLELTRKATGGLPPVEKPGRKPYGYRKPKSAPGVPPGDPAPEASEGDETVHYGPRPENELSPEALKGLDDFGYFRRRYLGRGPSEWQVEAAHQMLELLSTPDREYAVVNVAPGVGKSTLFTHDLPVWLICRDRRIRIMIGSKTETQAQKYVDRIRLTLQRSYIQHPRASQLRQGLAVEPEGVLSQDYGRFRGLDREVWTRGAFTVAQQQGEVSTEKENTCAGYGMDSQILGQRVDVAIWDDLVDNANIRTPYARETLQRWWGDEAESRLDRDAAGLMILQGQRLDPNDLYRWALDQQAFDDDGMADRKYRHIVYPAHFEDRCQGLHHPGAPSYPEGCLLDSYRLPWPELAAAEANNRERFRVLYQQVDNDPASAMVRRIWVSGGTDPDTGEVYPGCWDHGRNTGELPVLQGTVHSVCTADPAPSRYWSIQWWLYEPGTGRRHLMDVMRRQMTASEFLDWNHDEGRFVGIMEEWSTRARLLGVPVTHWIVEHNAAQKFMLQYDHVKRWAQQRSVAIIPHQTQAVNKLDQSIGVTAVGPHYRHGRIRLPAGDGPLSPAALASNKLVNEAVGWPSYSTSDCLMAQWFLEVKIPVLWPSNVETSPQRRPTWLGSSRRSVR